MLDSTALHAFAVFAEDTNLSRAARRLGLSQPAVHAQLRRLADALGVPLYHRVGRGLSLTREGIEVAAFARDAEERARDLTARLGGEQGERRLVLATGAGALLHVLGPGLRAFGKTYAGRLEVMTADAPAAIDAVLRGAAHVGVAALDAVPEGLVATRLTDAPQRLVVPRGHPLARTGPVSLTELEGQRMVLPPEGRPQRRTLDAGLAAKGVRVRVGAVAVGWDVVLRLVELGSGIAIVNGTVPIPRGLVARAVRELPRVRYVALTRPAPRADPAGLVAALREHGDGWRSKERR